MRLSKKRPLVKLSEPERIRVSLALTRELRKVGAATCGQLAARLAIEVGIVQAVLDDWRFVRQFRPPMCQYSLDPELR